MNPVFLAGGIFLVTYGLIAAERVHRTLAALAGGIAVIVAGLVTQEEAFLAVDWNVIFLLTGMMVIANVIGETGLFQWIGVRAVKAGRGEPMRIMILLAVFAAVASAFLDNVTVVVLLAPVLLFVSASLRISPVPMLIAVVIASNVGGTATLIGDPPNVLIGSAAGYDFVTFMANLAPISIVILAAVLVAMRVMMTRELRSRSRHVPDLDSLETSALITDPVLLRRAVIVLGGVIVGFLLQAPLGLQAATIAIAGATILTLWAHREPPVVLREVEWATLLFFVGLFMTVEALVQVGIVSTIAERTLDLTGGDVKLAAPLLLWFSAGASGIVDNIPYTAAVIPVVERMGEVMPIAPLWWALALGACLGGNLTLVGASANVIVASLAERSGHTITFGRFLRYGIVATVVSLLLATGYLYLRYLRPL